MLLHLVLTCSLGAHHDGEKDDATASACPPADKFIMVPAVSSFSPGVAYTVNPWRFSTCSVKQFKNYIQSLGNNKKVQMRQQNYTNVMFYMRSYRIGITCRSEY
ncbi:hypothetical protein DPMN_073759 [Dreissena polymorpha]|uniref:Uncharacterized protein n=1 Tax=Dreissena polymorpha TaxID=45954 RepID=A0A9D4BZL6_DREPO|nr:hypothetical protein DPMN_073759 [Dreissena polymorpha]